MAPNDLQEWLRQLQQKQAKEPEPTSILGKLAKGFVDAAMEVSETPSQRPIAGQGRRETVQKRQSNAGVEESAQQPHRMSVEEVLRARLKDKEHSEDTQKKKSRRSKKASAKAMAASQSDQPVKAKKSVGKFKRFLHAKPQNVRDAMVLSEILRPPPGLRNFHDF